MPTFINQDTRLLTLATPLGADVLLLTAFSGQEEMSRPFRYELEMLSEEEAIDPSETVGKGVTWGVQQVDRATRYFHGVVSRFTAGSTRLHRRRAYRAEVVPYLWFLTRTANCRIFQNLSTPEILETVFADYGLTDYELKLLWRDYPRHEYCVQYRETAFDFVSRLMEHEGIFYYFKHTDGKHTLVLGDHRRSYTECVESEVEYSAGSLAANHVTVWERHHEFRPGRWAQTDYNFRSPSAPMRTDCKTLVRLPEAPRWEVFDYPGAYPVKRDGEVLTRIRMEEEEAAHEVVSASSTCCTFTPGGTFTLTAHAVAAEAGQAHVITSIRHAATDPSHEANGHPAEYHNSFTCIPDSVTFRPARLTPRPTVQGPQTAVVVGPAGEEIYTDKYGRIKVQFHWDREGNRDENSSCWIRVSTTWGGKRWGFIQVPRIGHEVIVGFEEGDPDRPLVLGSVYNAEQMPPNTLPAAKMVSGIMSNSTPGGGGYNGMMLNDTKGKEGMTLHAQYDMDTTVEHDQSTTVHNNRTDKIDVDDSETVGANQSISIGSNQTIRIGADQALDVGANQKATIGVDQTVKVGARVLVDAGAEIVLKTGASVLTMKSDGTITLQGVNITVTASATINENAPDITITGGSTATVGVGGQNTAYDTGRVATSGAAINSSAVGMHEITGALVKIN